MHSPKYTVKVVINLNSKRESEKCQSVYLYRKWAQNLDGLISHSKAGKKASKLTSILQAFLIWSTDLLTYFSDTAPETPNLQCSTDDLSKPSLPPEFLLNARSANHVWNNLLANHPIQKTLKYCALLFRENKFKPFQFAWSLFSWVLNFILLSLKRSISRESKLISASQL